MKAKIAANIFTKIAKSKAVTKVVRVVVENAPKILTGVSIASSVAASIFAVKGTILAVKIEQERKEKIEKGELPKPEHPKWEVVKSVWKCYIPTATCLIVSVGTGLSGIEMSTARTAMATTACKLTEQAFEEYRNETIAKLGESGEKEIRQNVAKHEAEMYANRNEIQPSTLVISPYEKILIEDKITGQIFQGDVNTIKDAINKINYELSHGYMDYISVLDYAFELGLNSKDEYRGWNVSTDGLLEPRFELGTTPDGRPCMVLSTSVWPHEGYNMYS